MVKIKEIRITANYAWSPKSNHPVYIAAGTAAQQLDATFSSNASLELYAIDITQSSLLSKCAGKVDVKDRFHKIVWGSTYTDSSNLSGLVVCGTDKGGIEIYDPEKILSSSNDCLIFSTSNHTGPVRALDFNAFQKNLFASGANDSEIYIWDLKNPSSPMTPGKKSEPLSAISSIVWNKQVQHILASTSSISSGPCCVVWDLRKNEPIIKVQDPSGRMQCSDAAWHPEIATQLLLASEDDHLPVVQLWDLRFATSPMKVLEKHKRGVISLAWCPQDPDLLLTCGKDNHVYCWNPNASPPEVVSELDTHAQWCFDVQWCPRNPNMLSSGSFDGHISIHSLMGGDVPAEVESASQIQQNAVAEAFGSSAFAVEQQPTTATTTTTTKKMAAPLKIPPKWMRRPCGATFSFGGKLVTFQNQAPDENQPKQNVRRSVVVNQVVTESNLVERSNKLRAALVGNAQCATYCQQKIDGASNEFEEDFWNFVKVNFASEPRQEYLQLLGYNSKELQAKFKTVIGLKPVKENLSSQIDNLTVSAKGEPNDVTISNSGSSNALDAFEQIAASSEGKAAKAEVKEPMVISTGEKDLDSLISQALLIGDYESAVDLCIHGEQMADAIVIASAGGAALLKKTQKRYFQTSNAKMLHRLISAVITKDWDEIVSTCDLNNWKEALASLLTYGSQEDLVNYCDKLGERLEADSKLRARACLCYVCSGNVDKFVRCWGDINSDEVRSVGLLQDLIEKMMVLLHVVDARHHGRGLGEVASDKLAQYASTLAAQGQLSAAMEILPPSCDKQSVQVLRDRLFHSQGDAMAGKQLPVFPFSRDGTNPAQRPSAQVIPRQQQQQPYSRKPFAPQPQHNQAPLSRTQQPQPSPVLPLTSAPQPAVNRPRRPNPYGGNMMQRQVPTGPQQAPANIFTPQSQPAAPFPMQPSISSSQPVPPFMPTSIAPISNGPPSMMQPQPPVSSVGSPPMSDAYGDGGRLRQPGGWNDPPPLDPNRVPKKKKSPQQQFQPENYNIMTPTQPAQAPPGSYYPSVPTHPPASAPPSSMMQPMPSAPPPGLGPGPMLGVVNQAPVGNQSAMMQNVQLPSQETVYTEESDDWSYDATDQPAASAPSVPTAAVKDVPKAPIPSEHQVLQAQFDGLAKKCEAQANSAQMKRKLDDCSRRLEFLYDKLRANSLSPNILKGLHQVASSVGSRDYNTGLRYHSQIVSSSNFSEISAFMPGLKSLLQIAGHLRV